MNVTKYIKSTAIAAAIFRKHGFGEFGGLWHNTYKHCKTVKVYAKRTAENQRVVAEIYKTFAELGIQRINVKTNVNSIIVRIPNDSLIKE